MSSTPEKPHREPHALDEHTSKAGLRAVATFEAGKGALVLALAVGVIAVHDRIEDLAEELLYHLHIDFDHRLAQALMHGATKISDMHVWMVVSIACSYAGVRFVEAWGLWHRRVWAEWFALLSGALYLPLEILKVAERASWERVGVLAINLMIIGYMAFIRISEARLVENGKSLSFDQLGSAQGRGAERGMGQGRQHYAC
jgi:uncharacterized membrane protein (DUF2068 family)